MLNPYLIFNGNCKEAMAFYKDCFGGDLNMQTFGEAPMESAPENRERIIHASLVKNGFVLMASDSTPEHAVQNGNAVQISVNCASLEEIESLFAKMSQGGKVSAPLADTFWGARFGMLTDKFGVPWMFSFEKRQS